MLVSELDLSPVAKAAAEKLVASFPQVVFTSGRRDLRKQAEVMATNELRDPGWVKSTYKISEPFVWWIEQNKPKSQVEMAIGFHDVMMRMSQEEIDQVSKHLSGNAFDIKPIIDKTGMPTTEGFEIVDFCRSKLGAEKILLREGNLIVWHVQFSTVKEVVNV